MNLAALLGDVARSLFKRPVTVKYPVNPSPAPERLRGKLVYDPSRCSGCQLCVNDCPAFAIRMTIIDRKEKRFIMEYDENRCIFCSQCVQSCRTNSLKMSNTVWELAALTQDGFRVYYGNADDIKKYLSGELVKAPAGSS